MHTGMQFIQLKVPGFNTSMENNESYKQVDEQAHVADMKLEEQIREVIVKIKEKCSHPC